MEKQKVKSVKFKNEWDSNYGKFFNFDIEFEGGLTGVYASKTNPQKSFIVGEEKEFTVESSQYGNKIKPVQQQQQGFNKKPYDPVADNFRQALIVAQSSITKVVELVIAEKVKMEDLQKVTDRLMQIQFDLAKKFQSEVNKPLEV